MQKLFLIAALIMLSLYVNAQKGEIVAKKMISTGNEVFYTDSLSTYHVGLEGVFVIDKLKVGMGLYKSANRDPLDYTMQVFIRVDFFRKRKP